VGTINVLNRLKLELNNKDYFTDTEYIVYLNENGLDETNTYDKLNMEKKLLQTVLAILEAVSNDIDKMRKVQTEFSTTDGAYNYLSKRINDLKDKIGSLPDAGSSANDGSGNITRLFGSRW
jgi:hypothetical protein